MTQAARRAALWRAGGDEFSPATEAYLDAVEAADGQALEPAVRTAMGVFAEYRIPLGGACCLMAGARTLAGALVPMVGQTPTNTGFVSGDYDRVSGLTGDGSTKFINSNRPNNAEPRNSKHLAIYVSALGSSTPFRPLIGSGQANGDSLLSNRWDFGAKATLWLNGVRAEINPFTLQTGTYAASRSGSTGFTVRANGQDYAITAASAAPTSRTIQVFKSNDISIWADATISFYSIGESIDLLLLESSLTTLFADLESAIP